MKNNPHYNKNDKQYFSNDKATNQSQLEKLKNLTVDGMVKALTSTQGVAVIKDLSKR